MITTDSPTQEQNEPPTFAIINCKTGRHFSITDGSVVTSPEDSVNDFHNHWALKNATSAGEANQVSYAIVNGATGEILNQSDGESIQLRSEEAKEPTAQWKLVPQQDDAEIFYIANGQSGTCLKDTQLGPETAAISTDVIPATFNDRDSTLLWKFVRLAAAKENLTPIGEVMPKKLRAKDAMLYLINQWQENKIPKTWKPGLNIALINKGESDEKGRFDDRLSGGNVRIDFQKWNSDDASTANVQGQVLKKSVLQVNIKPVDHWGVEAIQEKLRESMRDVKEVWML